MSAGMIAIISAEEAAQLELVPREELCANTAACLLRAGHEDPCKETARPPSARPKWEAKLGLRDPVGWRETKGAKP